MDTLVAQCDTNRYFSIDEHLIVRANPWIINRLANTDYYRLKEKGITAKNQKDIAVLRKRDRIRIPNQEKAEELRIKMAKTIIDINLPEYLLRIIEGENILYEFPVRIGQTREKFLAMAGHHVDLRTRTGTGYISRINKNPAFINPANNKVYKTTLRDDGIRTQLPLIPWLEPTINGTRYGQLIHPTTNPRTLGKKSSNGCIGTREDHAWYIYYYAPLNTKVVIRNDRNIIDSQGDTIRLPDIYPGYERRKQKDLPIAAALPVELLQAYLVDCPDCSE